MTPNERIDAALDSVLKASGSALKNYTMQLTLDRMRDAMRKVMSESYIAGSNANFEAMKKARQNAAMTGPEGVQVHEPVVRGENTLEPK